MSAVREFPSVTLTNNSNLVQINTNDSNFSVVPGSVIVVAGDRPRVVTSGDTVNRTLTLSIAYIGDDIVEKSAALIPLGQNDALLSAITSLTQAQNGLAEAYGDGPGTVGEISFSMIIDPPVTATQWPTWAQVQGDIVEVLPETATRFPTFPEVGGKISVEQLPDDIDTDNKRTQALSLPVRQNQSLTHLLSDYPTLKKTVDIPTYSPNNKREMLFDDVRQVAYVALTEEWLPIPNIIATREFLLTTANNRVYFNNAYTGNLTLRVYPMGSGGSGLPDSPSLANFEWHTVTTAVSNLGQFGSSFIGLIDFIQTDDGYETLSTARSHFNSIDAYYGNSNGDATVNQFKQFSLRQDGYWYSSDVMPENPNSMGGSWSQDVNDKKLFTVTNAESGSDALRPFSDTWDDFEFEIVIVTDITQPMALTLSNSEASSTPFAGTYRFITRQDRLYFKRRAAHSPITGSVRVESLRLRVKHYE
ncbi:hypothetical protein MHN00_13930 [Alteromonas sp. Cnat2-8]|uniref:hypothetical protein n=1 Tax=Alteromonas sp. Cnat2-8 TaxID=2917728 RepID=UPI001EF6667A|nr:hypothetical protein [Alteromonas sp. Cnat2-8]MCG7654653.1 hypothetical protein [Alteromonas sp. Cnat2-8]